MNKELILGKPIWLSAYPNEGQLDYFGFRFYRQPFRRYLVRGAAANNFKTAKTLIYYAAISYAFKKHYAIPVDQRLSDEQLTKWKDWYQTANYIYVVGCYEMNQKVPDTGFTGANQEAHKYFISTLENKKPFLLSDVKERFYPKDRQWGYLSQFWKAPLRFFRCLLDVNNCIVGEYGESAFKELSSNKNWTLFLNILQKGKMESDEYPKVKEIINCYSLNAAEKRLAKSIIFDNQNIVGKYNDEYRENYQFIKNLLHNGHEGFIPKTKEDIALLLSYVHLKDIPISNVDIAWKILVSSLMFEIGICRFFTAISQECSGSSIDKKTIESCIDASIKQSSLDPNMSLKSAIGVWKLSHLNSINSFVELYGNLLEKPALNYFVDGLISGVIISLVSPSKTDEAIFMDLTDPYHHFVPQEFFRTRKVDLDMSLKDFIQSLCVSLIEEQYQFSLDRMNYGQKAKFILSRSEYSDEYIFQIDHRNFSENRGIIEMIDSCLKLWKSSGL